MRPGSTSITVTVTVATRPISASPTAAGWSGRLTAGQMPAEIQGARAGELGEEFANRGPTPGRAVTSAKRGLRMFGRTGVS